jgi:hypothetical protein
VETGSALICRRPEPLRSMQGATRQSCKKSGLAGPPTQHDHFSPERDEFDFCSGRSGPSWSAALVPQWRVTPEPVLGPRCAQHSVGLHSAHLAVTVNPQPPPADLPSRHKIRQQLDGSVEPHRFDKRLTWHAEQELAYGTETRETFETDSAETSKEVRIRILHVLGSGGRTNQVAQSRPVHKRRYQLAVLCVDGAGCEYTRHNGPFAELLCV